MPFFKISMALISILMWASFVLFDRMWIGLMEHQVDHGRGSASADGVDQMLAIARPVALYAALAASLGCAVSVLIDEVRKGLARGST